MDGAVAVTNVATAIQALTTIVEQGEGTSTGPGEVVGGGFAHFYRFMQIKKGRALVKVNDSGPVNERYTYSGVVIPFDPTGVYAVPDDPLAASYPAGSQAGALCDRFNGTYTSLLHALHATFNGAPAQLYAAIGLMMSLMGQAKDMMSGVPNPAVLAGPSFEFRPADEAGA